MPPEQEDAHWALMGKPLMREWRAYWQATADGAHDAAMRIWEKYGFRYAVGGAKADGVFYSNEEGISHD